MATWRYYGTWTMSLLSWTAFARMYETGRDCNPLYLEIENNGSRYYQTEEEIEHVIQGIAKQSDEDPDFIPNKLKALRLQMVKDNEELARINNQLSALLTNGELAELFNEYWEAYRDTIFGMGIDLFFDDIVSPKLATHLKETLEKNGGVDLFEKYHAILTSALKLTTTQKEEIAFLETLLDHPESNRSEAFAKHLEKYCHIPMWFDNAPWNIADLEKRASQYHSKEAIQQRLEQLQQEIPTRKKLTQEVLAKLNPNKEVRNLVAFIQEFAYLRQEGEIQISYHNYRGMPLKKEIAQRLSITLADLVYLTDEEIITNLKQKDPSLINILKERKSYCYVTMKNGKYRIFTGERAGQEAAKIKNQVITDSVDAEISVLKGVIGSSGFAKGKVRIIHGLDEIPTMQAGEILVVSGTSVEYLSAMQLSAGIICEIGGITSHAAVISRELNKPCLTRVPNATKILKTGELIELDARKGEIRRSI